MCFLPLSMCVLPRAWGTPSLEQSYVRWVSSVVTWAVAGVPDTVVWEAEVIPCLCLGVFSFVEEGNMLLFSSMPTLYIPISRDHLACLGPSSLCTAVFTTCKQGDMQVLKRGSQCLKRKTEMIVQAPGKSQTGASSMSMVWLLWQRCLGTVTRVAQWKVE